LPAETRYKFALNFIIKTFLLIDLENRQPPPEHVAAWIGETGEAWIFFGEQQINQLPHYWQIGEQVTIVPTSRPGRNSLDFHLILYLGYLVAKQKKKARFVVVADDADYDPAIEHAKAEGIDVVRISELPLEVSVPSAKGAPKQVTSRAAAQPSSVVPSAPVVTVSPRKSKTPNAIYAGILEDIRGPNTPRDLQALKSRIQSRIGHDPATQIVTRVLARLETMDVIKVADGKLIYLN